MMTTPDPLTKVDSPSQVQSYLEWHLFNRLPVFLLHRSLPKQLPAYIVGFDEKRKTINLSCLGAGEIEINANDNYAILGTSKNGSNFLASGQMVANPADGTELQLSFPHWLDVSQSRDSFRSPPASGESLHFSSLRGKKVDMTCRVRNVSMGGLAIEWDLANGAPDFSRGLVIETADLRSKKESIEISTLRVAHITKTTDCYLIGLCLVGTQPRAFNQLVLNAQRALFSI